MATRIRSYEQLEQRDYEFDSLWEGDGREEAETVLRDSLLEAGVPVGALAEIETVIEAHASRRSFHLAAEVLREVGRRLAGFKTHSAAVAHALGLDSAESGSLAVIGQRLGCSKQAIGNRVVEIRDALNFSRTQPPPTS